MNANGVATITAQRLLALSTIKGVGNGALGLIAEQVDLSAEDWLRGCMNVRPIAAAMSDASVLERALDYARRQVLLATSHRARILCVLDAEYQQMWSGCPRLPPILFVKGTLRPARETVAVIGTREPTRHGRSITQRIAAYLAASGASVLSGLALGCDGEAHRSVIDHGGHTVAVLAHGLQMIAPRQHEGLAHDLLAGGGALVTQYPFEDGPEPFKFAARDYLQSSMSRGVVLVQSDLRGGSLHASRAALQYGRWLAVVRPTATDIEQQSEKIRANLVLGELDPAKAARLLSCTMAQTERVWMLNDKDDYPRLMS